MSVHVLFFGIRSASLGAVFIMIIHVIIIIIGFLGLDIPKESLALDSFPGLLICCYPAAWIVRLRYQSSFVILQTLTVLSIDRIPE